MIELIECRYYDQYQAQLIKCFKLDEAHTCQLERYQTSKNFKESKIDSADLTDGHMLKVKGWLTDFK